MNQITKAIIPTAGYGTRRLPITKTIEKNMLPVGNRPIIDYVIEECALAGITDIYLVVNDIENSQIAQYYGHNKKLEQYLSSRNATEKSEKLNTLPKGVKLYFIEQDVNDKYGTAVPVALALAECGTDEPVVFCNGDDFFINAKDGSEVKTMVKAAVNSVDSVMLGYKVPREEVTKYGMIKIDAQDSMTSIIEKPKPAEVISNLVSINRIILSPGLLKVIKDYVTDNNFGPNDQEYMITDCYAEYIRQGGKIRVVGSTGEWLDCGSLKGWLYANEIIGKNLLKNA
jgi:UTP--glucose-1-phosphate uridylyltransferase